MPRFPAALTALCLLAAPAFAAERVGSVVYSVATDPITDANTSRLLLQEASDTTGSTYLSVLCRNGKPDVFLNTKNPLYSEADADADLYPSLQYRVDQRPFVTEDDTLGATVDGKIDTTTLALAEAADLRFASAVATGQSRVAVRVKRLGKGDLTYIFPLAGFGTAWARVKACRGGATDRVQVTPNPSSPSASAVSVASGAPKFTQWSFTACTDELSGAVRPQLAPGRAQRCELTVDTVPNGAKPINASFQYELEYVENGVAKKLKLDGVDTWSAAGGGDVRFAQQGARLVFSLPLNVRARADRTYTSINAIGMIVFDNGSSKRVYERLAIR